MQNNQPPNPFNQGQEDRTGYIYPPSFYQPTPPMPTIGQPLMPSQPPANMLPPHLRNQQGVYQSPVRVPPVGQSMMPPQPPTNVLPPHLRNQDGVYQPPARVVPAPTPAPQETPKDEPPKFKKGGFVKKDGLIYAHRGEYVVPSKFVSKVRKIVTDAGITLPEM